MKSLTGMALVLLMTGCMQAPAPSYHDSNVPMSITTRGSIMALTGDWVVREALPEPARTSIIRFEQSENGQTSVQFTQSVCTETGCKAQRRIRPATRIAQNRLQLSSDDAHDDQELWVLWMDEAIRTAVIGAPDGSFAYILDRQREGGEDRIQAAREILDFNGFDTSALVAL